MSMHYFIYFLSFFISFFISIYSAIIKTNDDFLEYINKENELQFQNEIFIQNNDNINIESSSISFTGDIQTSILHLTNSLSFLEKCEKIEIKNITIYGDFNFHNNKNIIFQNVIYNGVFIANNEKSNSKSSIQILNSLFHLSEQQNGFEIKNYNVHIDSTNFYGNNLYNLFLLKLNGKKDNINTIKIENTYFTGNYFNSGIQSTYTNITLSNTVFENCFNTKILKGYIPLNSID